MNKANEQSKPNKTVVATAGNVSRSLRAGRSIAAVPTFDVSTNMKKKLLPFLLLLLSIFSVAGEESKLDDAKLGDHVTIGHAAGFLKYRGIHSGVMVYALSLDIGSAMPSEDFRLYAKDERYSGAIFSLGMRSREGYRCVVEGDTLRIFVTKGLSREAVSKVPIAIIDLKQLISEYVEQAGGGQPATRPESK